MRDEHIRYLGTLGLLAECGVYVPNDLRDMIEAALRDACAANPTLRWRRILNRFVIESAALPVQHRSKAEGRTKP